LIILGRWWIILGRWWIILVRWLIILGRRRIILGRRRCVLDWLKIGEIILAGEILLLRALFGN